MCPALLLAVLLVLPALLAVLLVLPWSRAVPLLRLLGGWRSRLRVERINGLQHVAEISLAIQSERRQRSQIHVTQEKRATKSKI